MIRRDDQTSKNAQPAKPDRPGAASGGVVHSRRRLAGAGLSASVLLTLSGRSAFASHCTVSGMLSGNLSRPDHGIPCAGLSPGYWGTHPEDWVGGLIPGPCDPRETSGSCSNYKFVRQSKLLDAGFSQFEIDMYNTEYNSATLFNEYLPSGIIAADKTLMQALWHYKGPNNVAFHAAAALCNIAYFGPVVYGYTVAGLYDYITANLGNTMVLAGELDALNNRS